MTHGHTELTTYVINKTQYFVRTIVGTIDVFLLYLYHTLYVSFTYPDLP